MSKVCKKSQMCNFPLWQKGTGANYRKSIQCCIHERKAIRLVHVSMENDLFHGWECKTNGIMCFQSKQSRVSADGYRTYTCIPFELFE